MRTANGDFFESFNVVNVASLLLFKYCCVLEKFSKVLSSEYVDVQIN